MSSPSLANELQVTHRAAIREGTLELAVSLIWCRTYSELAKLSSTSPVCDEAKQTVQSILNSLARQRKREGAWFAGLDDTIQEYTTEAFQGRLPKLGDTFAERVDSAVQEWSRQWDIRSSGPSTVNLPADGGVKLQRSRRFQSPDNRPETGLSPLPATPTTRNDLPLREFLEKEGAVDFPQDDRQLSHESGRSRAAINNLRGVTADRCVSSWVTMALQLKRWQQLCGNLAAQPASPQITWIFTEEKLNPIFTNLELYKKRPGIWDKKLGGNRSPEIEPLFKDYLLILDSAIKRLEYLLKLIEEQRQCLPQSNPGQSRAIEVTRRAEVLLAGCLYESSVPVLLQQLDANWGPVDDSGKGLLEDLAEKLIHEKFSEKIQRVVTEAYYELKKRSSLDDATRLDCLARWGVLSALRVYLRYLVSCQGPSAELSPVQLELLQHFAQQLFHSQPISVHVFQGESDLSQWKQVGWQVRPIPREEVPAERDSLMVKVAGVALVIAGDQLPVLVSPAIIFEPPWRSELVQALRSFLRLPFDKLECAGPFPQWCEQLIGELEKFVSLREWLTQPEDPLGCHQLLLHRVVRQVYALSRNPEYNSAALRILLALKEEQVLAVHEPISRAPSDRDSLLFLVTGLKSLEELQEQFSPTEQRVTLHLIDQTGVPVPGLSRDCCFLAATDLSLTPLMKLLTQIQVGAEVDDALQQKPWWRNFVQIQAKLGSRSKDRDAADESQVGLELLNLLYPYVQAQGSTSAENVFRQVWTCLRDRPYELMVTPRLDLQTLQPILSSDFSAGVIISVIRDRSATGLQRVVTKLGANDTHGTVEIHLGSDIPATILNWWEFLEKCEQSQDLKPLGANRELQGLLADFQAWFTGQGPIPDPNRYSDAFANWIERQNWFVDALIAPADSPWATALPFLQDEGWVWIDSDYLERRNRASILQRGASSAALAKHLEFHQGIVDLVKRVQRHDRDWRSETSYVQELLCRLFLQIPKTAIDNLTSPQLLATLDEMYPALVELGAHYYGVSVRPQRWNFTDPSGALQQDGISADQIHAIYHDAVPTGKCFLAGVEIVCDGRPVPQQEGLNTSQVIHESVGPYPAGYADLWSHLELLRQGQIDTLNLLTSMWNWPTQKRLGPAEYQGEAIRFFDIFWETFFSGSEYQRCNLPLDEFQTLQQLLEEMLFSEFSLKFFTPEKETDFPKDWLNVRNNERQGGTGSKKLKLLRPGLYTPEDDWCRVRAEVVQV